VAEAISYLPPPLQLDDAVARELAAELADAEPALVEARKLKRLSEGRYPEAATVNVSGTEPRDRAEGDVATLLDHEARALAHAGRLGESLATGRAVLVVGRAVGDEPGLDAFGRRLGYQRQAVLCIERTLAQGTPPPDDLRATQELFDDEAARPLLLNGLRGASANTLRGIEEYRAGGRSAWQSQRKSGVGGWLDVGAPRRIRSIQAEVLRKETEGVEIAKLPFEEQGDRFAEMKSTVSPGGKDPVGYCVWLFTTRAEDYRRSQALLRCTITGLALECYRAEKERWPDRLDELGPAYLKAVPLDPFDTRPLRYKRLPDGVLVYSVGPDGQDDGGALNWKRDGAKGTDLGFRLWDVDQRRQPPAEVLPMPKEHAP
jgi:hypothetical protein